VALLGTFAWQNGEAVAAQDAIPVYLRDRVAQRPKSVLKSL